MVWHGMGKVGRYRHIQVVSVPYGAGRHVAGIQVTRQGKNHNNTMHRQVYII